MIHIPFLLVISIHSYQSYSLTRRTMSSKRKTFYSVIAAVRSSNTVIYEIPRQFYDVLIFPLHFDKY